MTGRPLFSRLYGFLAPRKPLLLGAAAALLLLSLAALPGLELSGDITPMLPEKPEDLAEDFKRLQETPFAQRVLVNLSAGPSASREELFNAGNRLAAAMKPPHFTEVLQGPPQGNASGFHDFFLAALPALATPEDLARIQASLERENIRARLEEIRERLSLPGFEPMKALFRRDPLGLHRIVLEKLRHLSLLPDVRIQGSRFMSPDGRSLLLVAETPIKITDADGSREIVEHLKALTSREVPPSIRAAFLSGHRYTVSNAECVKKDLRVVLGVSSAAILALFLICLRTRALFLVFLVPAAALCMAAAFLSLAFDKVSAIAVGFGSVLLGITVDFAVHVYYSLENPQNDAAEALGTVSRPVLFGGLTSLAAFSVLLLSDIPGQRQLAVFSMGGIAAALLLCLVVLPHLIWPGRRKGAPRLFGFGMERKGRWRRAILAGWIVLLGLGIWQSTKIRIDGDLRTLNRVSDELRAAEETFQETWGDLRGRAFIFSEGPDLGSALETNDRVFSVLSGRIEPGRLTSLSPVLPSTERQASALDRWETFWSPERSALAERLLREEGRALGFAEGAFVPFYEYLERSPDPLSPQDLRKAGLGKAVDAMVIEKMGRIRVITLAPDTPRLAALMDSVQGEMPHARFVSQSHFGDRIGRAVERDFARFLGFASLAVVLLLAVIFRNAGKAAASLVPVLTGLAFMGGMMGIAGVPFTPFNVAAILLVVGLAVDYGIFMVSALAEDRGRGTRRAVLVSGLTTLAGFGALALARHPALHSIGVTVLFGITAAVPSALFVVPALFPGEKRDPGDGKDLPAG